MGEVRQSRLHVGLFFSVPGHADLEAARVTPVPFRHCHGQPPDDAVTLDVPCYLHARRNVRRLRFHIIAGIGCAGRLPVYVDVNTLHATHGRALTFGTGVKLANPKLQVIVVMGDGDATAIGGNHFIHAARRNMDILVILVNNFIYGMTGGQNAPTTPLTARSSTMPFGNFERPFNLPHLAESCGATFVSRWTCLHIRRLTKCFRMALRRKGFRFIEVIAPCSTLYARLNRLGSGLNLMQFYHDEAEIKHGADTREVDIGFQDKIVCGNFVDTERPTFLEAMHSHYSEVLGDRYVPMAPEGGWLHD